MHTQTTSAPSLAIDVLARDTLERLSEGDLATVRESEFIFAALAKHRERTSRLTYLPLGICRNCEERCAPGETYCDDDCRIDHQQRECRAARLRA
ncbi:hypothetical protein [Rhizobacter sp. SG703]|uniref:hypothetical protein n=1 Tax=Rhizobacter sp. SG703 TaxID=2587140 RepID=UPI0014477396|nr:hypothetical protein [Rhizobacter sp. SG703]NKI97555.1 hypothetical protein [Rhizobacter sp. SG703]